MLKSNTILGVSYTLGCEEYKHGIVTQNWENWPCAVPIVYSAEDDLVMQELHGSSISTAVLFSPTQYNSGRWAYNTPASMIRTINLKPLCGNHKVVTIDKIDPSKFDRLIEFVHDVGGISLVIELDGSKDKIVPAISKLARLYKYNSLFFYNKYGPQLLEGPEDKFVCVVTLLDIPYCVPLFNMRKVDGIGLSFSTATTIRSEYNGVLNRSFQADLVLTNYEENVFVIDGAVVNQPQPINSSLYEEMAVMAAQKLKRVDSKPPPKHKFKGMSDDKYTAGFKTGEPKEWGLHNNGKPVLVAEMPEPSLEAVPHEMKQMEQPQHHPDQPVHFSSDGTVSGLTTTYTTTATGWIGQDHAPVDEDEVISEDNEE